MNNYNFTARHPIYCNLVPVKASLSFPSDAEAVAHAAALADRLKYNVQVEGPTRGYTVYPMYPSM